MANVYTPFNVRVLNVNSAGVVLAWDIDTAISALTTYYKIYSSKNGTEFEYVKTVPGKTLTVDIPAEDYFIKVSSVVGSYGESELSSAVKVNSVKPDNCCQQTSFLAVNPFGIPSPLKVDEKGNLIIIETPQLFNQIAVNDVITESPIITIPWAATSIVETLKVLKDESSTAGFGIEIYDTQTPTGKPVASFHNRLAENIILEDQHIRVNNANSTDQLSFKIICDGITPNSFTVVMHGRHLR